MVGGGSEFTRWEKKKKKKKHETREEEKLLNNDLDLAQCWVKERDDWVQRNKTRLGEKKQHVWSPPPKINWGREKKICPNESFQSLGRRSTPPNEGKRAASAGRGRRNVNVCFVKRRGLQSWCWQRFCSCGDVWSSVWTVRAGPHFFLGSFTFHWLHCAHILWLSLRATPHYSGLLQLFSASLHKCFSLNASTHLLNS